MRAEHAAEDIAAAFHMGWCYAQMGLDQRGFELVTFGMDLDLKNMARIGFIDRRRAYGAVDGLAEWDRLASP